MMDPSKCSWFLFFGTTPMGDIIKSLNGGDGNGPLICFATSSFDNFSSITCRILEGRY